MSGSQLVMASSGDSQRHHNHNHNNQRPATTAESSSSEPNMDTTSNGSTTLGDSSPSRGQSRDDSSTHTTGHLQSTRHLKSREKLSVVIPSEQKSLVTPTIVADCTSGQLFDSLVQLTGQDGVGLFTGLPSCTPISADALPVTSNLSAVNPFFWGVTGYNGQSLDGSTAALAGNQQKRPTFEPASNIRPPNSNGTNSQTDAQASSSKTPNEVAQSADKQNGQMSLGQIQAASAMILSPFSFLFPPEANPLLRLGFTSGQQRPLAGASAANSSTSTNTSTSSSSLAQASAASASQQHLNRSNESERSPQQLELELEQQSDSKQEAQDLTSASQVSSSNQQVHKHPTSQRQHLTSQTQQPATSETNPNLNAQGDNHLSAVQNLISPNCTSQQQPQFSQAPSQLECRQSVQTDKRQLANSQSSTRGHLASTIPLSVAATPDTSTVSNSAIQHQLQQLKSQPQQQQPHNQAQHIPHMHLECLDTQPPLAHHLSGSSDLHFNRLNLSLDINQHQHQHQHQSQSPSANLVAQFGQQPPSLLLLNTNHVAGSSPRLLSDHFRQHHQQYQSYSSQFNSVAYLPQQHDAKLMPCSNVITTGLYEEPNYRQFTQASGLNQQIAQHKNILNSNANEMTNSMSVSPDQQARLMAQIASISSGQSVNCSPENHPNAVNNKGQVHEPIDSNSENRPLTQACARLATSSNNQPNSTSNTTKTDNQRTTHQTCVNQHSATFKIHQVKCSNKNGENKLKNEEVPTTIVKKKSKGGRRKKQVTDEELQARKNRSKERNRVAAKRCRQKRKVFLNELQRKIDKLQVSNAMRYVYVYLIHNIHYLY